MVALPRRRYSATVPLVLPPRLAPGARVALVSPAGPLRGLEDLTRAEDNARAFGWEPVASPNALARAGYFAGPDADRLDDLNTALRDPRVDAIWCVRGGYGAMRLLDGVDYAALARRPRPLIGYSDITALHCAVHARAGVGTFHGPTARARLSDFTRESLHRAVVDGADPCGEGAGARVLRRGRAEGWLAGGNLAVLAALAGTAYAPRFDGAIVVIEDVNEAVYRIDRLLRQLLLAGAFAGCRALAFGHFTEVPPGGGDGDGERALDDVLRELADTLGVPCVAGMPVGHIDDQWTIPLGAPAALDADAIRLTVLPHAVAVAAT